MNKITFFTLILIFALSACNTNKHTVTHQQEIPLDAGMLYYYFSNNQTDATAKYSEKEILIEGKIVEFYKDKSGIMIVILAESDSSSGIECHFPSDFVLESPFKKGESLKINGTCSGFDKNVIVKNCKIIE